MNRRVAEHNERKTSATSQDTGTEPHHAAGSRAADAAARVAARYAKAPSYSEMLADEARAAVRAAEAASRAALNAQAAAESLLAGIESAAPQQEWKQDFFTSAPQEPARTQVAEPAGPIALPTVFPVAPISAQPSTQLAAPLATPAYRPNSAVGRPSYEIRWDADLPTRDAAIAKASSANAIYETHQTDRRVKPGDGDAAMALDGPEVVEPAQPIHANLIQFPRELVAARKARPRRAEGQYATQPEDQAQLSIFEVDPWSISTEPPAASEAGTAQWTGPDWSGITLDEEPRDDFDGETVYEEREFPAVSALQLAPMGRRLLASFVDFSLIVAIFLVAAALELISLPVLPAIKTLALDSIAGLALTAAIYMAVFFTLGMATPGMKYARLRLCTFAGGIPSLSQRWGRAAAVVLSLLPMGLGALLAIFDEQHLCWHDRLSGTYPRMG